MPTLEQSWQESPARLLSNADHLPTYTNETPELDIFETESQRQDAALAIVALSAQELGRSSAERRQYLEAAGNQYAGVRFLAGTRELYLLQHQLAANDASIDLQDPEVKQAIIDDIVGLRQLGERQFGKANPDRFNAIMARAHRNAHTMLAAPDTTDEMKVVAQRVLERFPPGDPELIDKLICEVSPDLVEHWYPAVAEKYHPLINLVEPYRSYSPNGLVRLFDRAIAAMKNEWGLQNAARWKAHLWNGNSLNVYQSTSSIRIPEGGAYTSSAAINLTVHEAGVHLLRILNGEKTGDPLLASGMPGYNADEEALADVLGQIAAQEIDEDLLTYDAAVGLANLEPRVPLAKLEEYILDLETLQNGQPFNSNQLLKLKRRVHRVTRGMPSFVIDGELHQVTYNADLKYMRDLPKAITFLEQHRNDPLKALDWVMGGKFAYSDPEQVKYYQQRAI